MGTLGVVTGMNMMGETVYFVFDTLRTGDGVFLSMMCSICSRIYPYLLPIFSACASVCEVFC